MSALPLFEKLFEGVPAPTGPPLTGTQLRDSGIESVLSHTPDWYRDKFIGLITGFPGGYLFTVEDVRALAGDPPEEVSPNCMGGLMRRAAAKKLIIRTAQRRNAKRVSLHASELTVWERL